MVFKKTSVREQLSTGGGGGANGNCSGFVCNFFPFHAELATGGGGMQIDFFPGENSRPATHRAKHTLGRGGHFICHRGVSYYGKNTTFTIKRFLNKKSVFFPSKLGGHFLEARRAFFCPRAAGVRNPGVQCKPHSPS